MQTDTSSDDRRFVLRLLRRLEQCPRPGQPRRRLDFEAWSDLCREYGLTREHDDGDVLNGWGDLLAVTHPDTHADRPLPDGAVTAMPGTALKVQALVGRARDRQGLWHPGDQSLLDERLALICGAERHNGRSQVIGVVCEGPDGPRRVG